MPPRSGSPGGSATSRARWSSRRSSCCGRAALRHRATNKSNWALILRRACVLGLVAFSPLIDQTPVRDPLGFLAIVPLVWAALRRGQRETATVGFVLSCFAIWGTLAGGGPFWRTSLNDSFLLLLMFLISTSVAEPCALRHDRDPAPHRGAAARGARQGVKRRPRSKRPASSSPRRRRWRRSASSPAASRTISTIC